MKIDPAQPFLDWYASAAQGAVYVYHCGGHILNGRGKIPAAKVAWDFARRGGVTLTQKRIGPGMFAYTATRRDWDGLSKSFPIADVENIGIQRKGPPIKRVQS